MKSRRLGPILVSLGIFGGVLGVLLAFAYPLWDFHGKMPFILPTWTVFWDRQGRETNWVGLAAEIGIAAALAMIPLQVIGDDHRKPRG